MFFTYLGRELRRRMRQASFIALGLAVGIGLVITVTAASSGLKNAQGTVLHSLYGVGTDITVTKAPSRGSGGPFGFRVQGQGGSSASRRKAGTKFKVIGTVAEPQGGTTTDVYIPLVRAQSLAGMKNQVNTIYVAAASAADISAVQQSIMGQLPEATVTTSSDLASQVTGSLASASSLASSLGKWLAIAVLAAAFAVASLLTMSAVSRRVREFGTLKALGWRSRRVIGQVMGETLAMGLVGGIVGVALGYAGAALVSGLVGPLSATVGQNTGSASPGGSQAFGPPGGGAFGRLSDAAKTISVHLTAPVTASAILLAVLLAIAGGLVAGTFGGWRAARLRPAAALAQVR